MRAVFALVLAACTDVGPAQLPPVAPGSLVLSVDALVPGMPAVHTVSGARPGAYVYLGASELPPQPGPCLTAAGSLCLDLASPTLLGTARADGAGEASFLLATPETLPSGARLTLQALAIQGRQGLASATSPALRVVVDDDADGDGVPGSEDCDDADPTVFPGAEEACNGVDDDCDPATSEVGRVTLNGAVYPSLVEAIDAAPWGAEVTVCGGEHVLPFVQVHRALTLVGEGPDRAVLRPQSDRILRATGDFHARHVQFEGGRPPASGLGHAVQLDCPVWCQRHSFEDVVFTDHTAGALYCADRQLEVDDTVFRDNHGGGAVRLEDTYATFDDVRLVDNSNTAPGGAASVIGGALWLSGPSEIARNQAPAGGAVFLDHARLGSQWDDWSDNVPDDILLEGDSYDVSTLDPPYACYGTHQGGAFGCQ